jgi:hypothetical protein
MITPMLLFWGSCAGGGAGLVLIAGALRRRAIAMVVINAIALAVNDG